MSSQVIPLQNDVRAFTTFQLLGAVFGVTRLDNKSSTCVCNSTPKREKSQAFVAILSHLFVRMSVAQEVRIHGFQHCLVVPTE